MLKLRLKLCNYFLSKVVVGQINKWANKLNNLCVFSIFCCFPRYLCSLFVLIDFINGSFVHSIYLLVSKDMFNT